MHEQLRLSRRRRCSRPGQPWCGDPGRRRAAAALPLTPPSLHPAGQDPAHHDQGPRARPDDDQVRALSAGLASPTPRRRAASLRTGTIATAISSSPAQRTTCRRSGTLRTASAHPAAAAAAAALAHEPPPRAGERIGTYHGHCGTVWCLDVNWDSTKLLSGSADNCCKLWEVQSGECLHTWKHTAPVRCVGFAMGDKRFLTVLDNIMGNVPTIYVWELELNNLVRGRARVASRPPPLSPLALPTRQTTRTARCSRSLATRARLGAPCGALSTRRSTPSRTTPRCACGTQTQAQAGPGGPGGGGGGQAAATCGDRRASGRRGGEARHGGGAHQEDHRPPALLRQDAPLHLLHRPGDCGSGRVAAAE